MVYFQYHLNCQHFPDNEGDNEFSLIKANQKIVFPSEIVGLVEKIQEFKLW